MNIYFSGIGGVAIGPLSEIAADAGYQVQGSDRQESLVTKQLERRGIPVSIGEQDGRFLQECHDKQPINWFIYTSALPSDHPELKLAKELGIKTAKRDELIAHIIAEKNLKLIAVAGTHGKTTTTGMLLWTLQQRNIAISYSIGTTLSWAPSGRFNPLSRYFLYECDEFDRNFLHFYPSISIITSIDYDHPDTYPTKESYLEAFSQFCRQSKLVIGWNTDLSMKDLGEKSVLHTIDKQNTELDIIHLDGLHNRQNAYLVYTTLTDHFNDPDDEILHLLETFPGTGRRFERLSTDYSLYSDYGHHPSEIQATLQLAKEAAMGDKIALVYQPHQNVRQHELRDLYTPKVFEDADEIYWVPTYLSREDPARDILSPLQLTTQLSEDKIHIADLNDDLWDTIKQLRCNGYLVLLMGAGTIDAWARERLKD